MSDKCDIKGCSNIFVAYWSPIGYMLKSLRVCAHHLRKDSAFDDDFSLWDVVRMKKPRSRKEELADAGIKVTKLECGGTKVHCKKCGYQGQLIVNVGISKIKCPRCEEKRLSESKGEKKIKKYAYKIRCKACGNIDYMSKEKLDLSQLRCSNCTKIGSTVYLRKAKIIMAKKKKTKKKVVLSSKKKIVEKKKTESTSKRAVGKTSGVGVVKTWVILLTTKELTDAEISKGMKAEFPGRESKIFDYVQTVRNRYNKGVLTKGEIPEKQSVRYEAKKQSKINRKK